MKQELDELCKLAAVDNDGNCPECVIVNSLDVIDCCKHFMNEDEIRHFVASHNTDDIQSILTDFGVELLNAVVDYQPIMQRLIENSVADKDKGRAANYPRLKIVGFQPQIIMKNIETLTEEIARYKNVCQGLLDKLGTFEVELIKIMPNDFEFEYRGVKYTSDFKESNVSEYGEALVFYDEYANGNDHPDYEMQYNVVEAVVPIYKKNLGDSYYLHGDLNVRIHHTTRQQVKEMAAALPAFLAALKKHFHKESAILEQLAGL